MENSISRDICYLSPKPPFCKGGLLEGQLHHNPMPDGIGFCFGCNKTVGYGKFHKPRVCYPPPKSPSCEGDLSLRSTYGVCNFGKALQNVQAFFFL